VGGEVAGQGFPQPGILLRIRRAPSGLGPAGRLAVQHRGEHLPAGDPKMLLATEDSLICASSSSFSTRCFSAVRSRIRLRRCGQVAPAPDRLGVDQGRPAHAPLATLASQTGPACRSWAGRAHS